MCPLRGVWQLIWEVYRSQGTRDIATPEEVNLRYKYPQNDPIESN